MNRTLCFFLLFITAFNSNSAETPSFTAFIDVNIVPMDQERILPHQTVLVSGTTIVAIGDVDQISIPDNAYKVEGDGTRYLLPGLADMHTHPSSDDATLYIANGVTTILHMGGDRLFQVRSLRSKIDDGTFLAPQIYFALMLNGSSGGLLVDNPVSARAAVTMAKTQDYDFIKVYNQLSEEVFVAILDEAKNKGIAVIGHGVRSVGLLAGLFKGQVMVAHAEEFYYTDFDRKRNVAAIPDIVEKTYQSDAFVTANLSAFEVMDHQWGKPDVLQQFLHDSRVKYISPEMRLVWRTQDYVQRSGSISLTFDFLKLFTKALADRGVPLLTGTDSPVIPGMFPGYSIHEELRTLVEAGLTSYQALSAATRTPGEFIARFVPDSNPFGTVKTGMRADLILVNSNPLDDLNTLKNPVGVMHGGQWKTAEDLHVIIENIKLQHDSVLQGLF